MLRHLQAVASIYDEFQEHISIPKLAKALYELANTHPYQAEGLSPNIQNSQQRGEGDDEEVYVCFDFWYRIEMQSWH